MDEHRGGERDQQALAGMSAERLAADREQRQRPEPHSEAEDAAERERRRLAAAIDGARADREPAGTPPE